MGSKFGFFLVPVSLIFDNEIAFVKFACLLAHEGIDMMAGSEIDKLHLQRESKICVLSSEELVNLARHLGVESKELKKLVLSRRIREKIEGDLDEAEDTKLLLENRLAFVSGKPPLLEEETTANSQKAKVKDE